MRGQWWWSQCVQLHNTTLSFLKQVIGSDFLYFFSGVSDDLSDPVVGEDCEAGLQPPDSPDPSIFPTLSFFLSPSLPIPLPQSTLPYPFILVHPGLTLYLSPPLTLPTILPQFPPYLALYCEALLNPSSLPSPILVAPKGVKARVRTSPTTQTRR